MSGAAFGQGNEPTLLDYVRCSGLESNLLDCTHNGLEIESCDHSQDAGVICTEGNHKENDSVYVVQFTSQQKRKYVLHTKVCSL